MASTGARLSWLEARLVGRRREGCSAVTLLFDVPGWPGHLPGQHVDVRLTAADGYSAQRSYSLAAPGRGARVELTVQVIETGEVSPFLARDLRLGDPVELRGPVGGWFVWPPEQTGPVLLLGGGSGVVPLMAMVRARHETGSRAPFQLVYSVRGPGDAFYAAELDRLARRDGGLRVAVLYSRTAPVGSSRPAGRLRPAELAELAWPAAQGPMNFVCGPTAFVDEVAGTLVSLGHPGHLIRTERFGASG
jgi:ferredoxin-NADP reductase